MQARKVAPIAHTITASVASLWRLTENGDFIPISAFVPKLDGVLAMIRFALLAAAFVSAGPTSAQPLTFPRCSAKITDNCVQAEARHARAAVATKKASGHAKAGAQHAKASHSDQHTSEASVQKAKSDTPLKR